MHAFWLWATLAAAADQIAWQAPPEDGLQFTRSHATASRNFQGLSRAQHRPFPIPAIAPAQSYNLSEVRLKTRKQRVWRPRAKGGTLAYEAARRAVMRERRGLPHPLDYTPLEWDQLHVDAPDVTDVDTLSGLAKMCSNAYVESDKRSSNGSREWYDVGDNWNVSVSFGWTDNGIRGHVFATPDNSTVVVAIKGTSAGGVVGGGGPTKDNDKTNDNLLFSCCCARVDWTWTPVCDCYRGGWKCEEDCVEDALIDKSVYFPLATDLYNNITQMYPRASIWLTGHSLGGAIASLLSLTFGVPCVTFEAPGDLMAARRLHLPLPPGREPDSPFGAVTHVYHTADPIPQGACTGSLSLCALGGFALESRCHTGQTILYDTVSELGWSMDIRTHGIVQVIEHVLKSDWDAPSSLKPRMFPIHWGGKKKPGEGDDDDDDGDGQRDDQRKHHRSSTNVPNAKPEKGCVDCPRWEYGHFK